MILPFSTKFPNGERTNFIQKIWAGLVQQYPEMSSLFKFDYERAYEEKFDCLWDGYWTEPDAAPKLHTIREDVKDRWKPGMKIHMVVFNRSKNQFRFAPVLECKGVQKIEIEINNSDGLILRYVTIDGRELLHSEIEELALNDGFNSVEAFFEWFKKDFEGKIIHWTDLKY